jgi:hypothetical protein
MNRMKPDFMPSWKNESWSLESCVENETVKETFIETGARGEQTRSPR